MTASARIVAGPSSHSVAGVSRKLKLAFGEDYGDIKATAIQLDLPSRHLVLAANQFSILPDGRVKPGSAAQDARADKQRGPADRGA